MMETMPGSEVTLRIGGDDVGVPPLNFAALKRAWPAIQSLGGKPDIVGQADAVIEIVAAALVRTRPELTAVEIAQRLEGREFLDLIHAAPRLFQASGLLAPPGAAKENGSKDRSDPPREEIVPGEAGAG